MNNQYHDLYGIEDVIRLYGSSKVNDIEAQYLDLYYSEGTEKFDCAMFERQSEC